MSEGTDGGDPGGEASALRKRLDRAEAELARRRVEVERLYQAVEEQQRIIARMQGSAAWQLASRLWTARDQALARIPALGPIYRAVAGRAGAFVRGERARAAPRSSLAGGYEAWLAHHAVAPAEIARLSADAERCVPAPMFSILVAVGDVPEAALRRCLDSVRGQAWPRWELKVALGAACAPGVEDVVERYAKEDARIAVERAGSTAVTGAFAHALAASRGDFVALVDPRACLASEALLAIVAKLSNDPDLDVVYSDDDRIDANGRRFAPFFKPEWSPDLLLSMDYVRGLAVLRRSAVDRAGGVRAVPGRQHAYDLVLRVTEQTARVGHVPRVLYHAGEGPDPTRGTPPAGDDEAALAILGDAIARRRLEAEVHVTRPGVFAVRYRVRGEPLVSIVMPTRDKVQVLRACVESLERGTRWRRWELLVVDNGTAEPEALAYLDDLARRHRVLRDGRRFNWSALNNAAAREARGDHLLFMNNDMEVIAGDWLKALLEHSQREEVGAVGARLLYPDRRIQHAGVVLGIGGAAGHAFKYVRDDAQEYASLAHAVRNVSAVTGACLMTRREAYEQVGGFDERLPVAFNDIDFCLKLREAGYLVVYTPFAELYHHESATRGVLHPPEDEALFRARWTHALLADPFYSPHLTRSREDYAIGE